ncbi:MAG: MgtC/SapB family protein [Epsilonproteobacteria bacterium]|nr:MgtC/SapB family protein [Campylobacterota bacterium]
MEDIKLIIISILLGFLIGLERNISFNEEREKGFAGTRTFALISLLGYLGAKLNSYYPNFLLLSFFGVILLSVIAYFLKVQTFKKQGSTTNISAIISFIIGILVYKQEVNLAIAITVTVVILLNIKNKLKNIELKLSTKDINAAILLLIMSFLILPLLPNKMIYYFNPYKTWLMAIIISALSFIGYLGIKIFGNRYGILLTGSAGGFVSSTAVTFSLTKLYTIHNDKSTLYTYASAISIANTIMFARVFIETLLINRQIALYIAPAYLLTTLFGLYVTYKFYKLSTSNITTSNLIEKNPLELDEALKFAAIFAIIYSLTYYLGNKYGNAGVYLVSLISGLTDVDAITLSLSSLGKHEISIKTASIGIAIATVSNTLFKYSIVLFFAKKELKKVMSKFFISVILFFTVVFVLRALFS